VPTYDYECSHCGHKFEAFQKISDKPLEQCPKCKKKVRRLIGSGSGIIFKGAGFYATDYRKGTKPAPQEVSKNAVCPKAKEGCRACQNA
jgi:putative FmdB family regulatory protein